NALIEQEQQRHEDAMNGIRQSEVSAALGGMSMMFGGLSSLMNTGNKKLFDIGKKAAVANAVVQGYLAIQNVLATVPYPFNIAAAAGMAVTTGVNIANIKAQQFGGGGTVSAPGGAPNVYQPPQPTIPNDLSGSGKSP